MAVSIWSLLKCFYRIPPPTVISTGVERSPARENPERDLSTSVEKTFLWVSSVGSPGLRLLDCSGVATERRDLLLARIQREISPLRSR